MFGLSLQGLTDSYLYGMSKQIATVSFVRMLVVETEGCLIYLEHGISGPTALFIFNLFFLI